MIEQCKRHGHPIRDRKRDRTPQGICRECARMATRDNNRRCREARRRLQAVEAALAQAV